MSDPFDVVKDEVQESMRIAKGLFDKYKTLNFNENRSSADNEELEVVKSQLQKCMRQIEWDVQDLTETVQIVESDPEKFSQVDPLEIQTRKIFLEQTKRELKRIHEEVFKKKNAANSKGGKQPASKVAATILNPLKKDKYTKLDEQINSDNQDFIDNQMLQQKKVMDDQDQHLEKASKVVDDIHEIAIDMREELENQNKGLDNLTTKVDQTHSLIERTKRKLQALMKNNNDRGKIICIIVLIVIIAAMLVAIVAMESLFQAIRIG